MPETCYRIILENKLLKKFASRPDVNVAKVWRDLRDKGRSFHTRRCHQKVLKLLRSYRYVLLNSEVVDGRASYAVTRKEKVYGWMDLWSTLMFLTAASIWSMLPTVTGGQWSEVASRSAASRNAEQSRSASGQRDGVNVNSWSGGGSAAGLAAASAAAVATSTVSVTIHDDTYVYTSCAPCKHHAYASS